jgi:hypothetical protein
MWKVKLQRWCRWVPLMAADPTASMSRVSPTHNSTWQKSLQDPMVQNHTSHHKPPAPCVTSVGCGCRTSKQLHADTLMALQTALTCVEGITPSSWHLSTYTAAGQDNQGQATISKQLQLLVFSRQCALL